MQNVRTTCTASWTCQPPPSFCLVAKLVSSSVHEGSESSDVVRSGTAKTESELASNWVYINDYKHNMCIYNFDYNKNNNNNIHIFLCSNELAMIHNRYACALCVCVCHI